MNDSRQVADLLNKEITPTLRIIRHLGSGGTCNVFEAYDSDLNCLVAVKCMLPSLLDEATQRRRFEQESQIMLRLEHREIIVRWEFRCAGTIPCYLTTSSQAIFSWLSQHHVPPMWLFLILMRLYVKQKEQSPI